MSGKVPDKTVLVMCANPTTDGYYELPGHTFVAYVDITPAIKTQAEHRAQLQQFRAAEQRALDKYTQLLAHPEDIQEDDEMRWFKRQGLGKTNMDVIRFQLDGARFNVEVSDALLRTPLPVEELSKIYYRGIDTVPADLNVDVIFSASCTKEAEQHLITAIKRHLRPGGQLYLTVSGPSVIDRDKELLQLFAPEPTFTTLPFRGPYFEARGALSGSQLYAILTRSPSTGGRRRKTLRRRRPLRKHSTRHALSEPGAWRPLRASRTRPSCSDWNTPRT